MPPKRTLTKKASPKAAKKAAPAASDPLPSVVEENTDPAAMDAQAEAASLASTKGETVTGKVVREVKIEEETVVKESITEEIVQETAEVNMMDEEDPEEEDPEEEEGEEEEGEGDKQTVDTEKRGVENISRDVSDGDGEDEENQEDDSTMYMQPPLAEGKKEKEIEIFVGRLDKGAVEEDLIKVFGAFGEIQSVRIAKHPVTQKSKGFAFIRYASMEDTKKALAELKDGTEVNGKQIRVSASQDNDTLYLGNVCKTWTKDQVIETLKSYGIEQIEDILLPDDPKNEGKIKGFAFLEFKTHLDAMTAFQRLRKPDAVFGRDVSAKVSFAQTPLHPSEEDLLKVKTVYVEGLPNSWDEAKVEEICKKYGEIEKIQLSMNFTSSKRKDFGFVEFTSRDGAVACVEGINSAQLGEGDVKVKANLARPAYKGRLAKQGARGGFKIQKDGEATEEVSKSKKKKGKSKAAQVKEVAQPNLKSPNKKQSSKSQVKVSGEKKGFKTALSAKGKKRGRKGADTTANQQPFKKARNNRNSGKGHGRPSTNNANPRSSYSSMQYAPPHQAVYAPRYGPPATSYPPVAYAGASGSQHRRHDLEPHAGYLPSAKPARNPYEYDLRRSGAYDSQPRSTHYAGVAPVQRSYPVYPSYAGYQAGYTYPSSGGYPHRGAY